MTSRLYPPRLSTLAVLLAVVSPTAALDARELRPGGKLLLTNGITSIDGASGGGLTPWAVIAGNETRDGVGISAHATTVAVKDYNERGGGVAVGLFDRVELSYARLDYDTNAIGGALGLGNDYRFKQDVFGAKLRVVGDAVYGDTRLPAIAVGVEHKRNHNGTIVRALGATQDTGTDFYVSATKLFLSRSVLVNVTARLTKANQLGLLGFGGDKENRRQLEIEGSLGYQISRRFVIGAEYRAKPDNLKVAREDDWYDIFAVYALNDYLTATVAYTDLGSVATVKGQRGVFLSLQAAY